MTFIANDFKEYLYFLLLCLKTFIYVMFILSPILLVYIYLIRSSGELLTSEDIYKLSISNDDILWNSGYYDSAHHLKLGIGAAMVPKVVILGSSRVMQLRKKMFSKIKKTSFIILVVEFIILVTLIKQLIG